MKFKDADWTLDGSTEKGLYPIEPVKRTWKLDKGRKNPVLAVSRTQLPLAPAFAITAHSSQGKTLRLRPQPYVMPSFLSTSASPKTKKHISSQEKPAETRPKKQNTRSAVLLDFNIHRRTHVSYGTVVASRVRSREDVLILRAFPAWLYQRGPPEGVAKLLQRLRGELNLDAFREATWPSAPCAACRRAKPLNLFADAQWQKVRANRPATCLACEKKKRADRNFQPGKRKKHTCTACNLEKIEDAFPRAQLTQEDADRLRQCLTCVKAKPTLTCSVCRETYPAKDFSSTMLTMPPHCTACKDCQLKVSGKDKRTRKGWFSCRACKESLPSSAAHKGDRQHCLNCTTSTMKEKGVQTCKKCGKQWQEEQVPAQARMRFCPSCRYITPKAKAKPRTKKRSFEESSLQVLTP